MRKSFQHCTKFYHWITKHSGKRSAKNKAKTDRKLHKIFIIHCSFSSFCFHYQNSTSTTTTEIKRNCRKVFWFSYRRLDGFFVFIILYFGIFGKCSQLQCFCWYSWYSGRSFLKKQFCSGKKLSSCLAKIFAG